MTTLLAELETKALKDFNGKSTPAYVYVFKHNAQTGIRLEAPDIVKEYTDGVPLGRDPKGRLFFYALKPDFNPGKKAEYNVTFPRRGTGHKTEVVIQVEFNHIGDTKPYARFLAAVPPRAQDDEDTKPFKGATQGSWVALDLTQATALATSTSTSSKVEIEVVSLKKKITFNVPSNVPGPTAMESWGYLLVKDLKHLKTGTTYYVDYNESRIMIFNKQGDQDAVAVWGSYEIDSDNQPFEASFQTTGATIVDT